MLEQKRAAASAALGALLGRASDEPLSGQFDFTAPAPLEPLSDLVQRLRERAPELRAAQEDVLRSDAAVDLARRDYFPDFALMGAYMNKNGLLAEWELGVRVTVPLYFWRRQRAAVTEQRLAKRAAERARDGERLDLEARLRELHAMAETSARPRRRLRRLADLRQGLAHARIGARLARGRERRSPHDVERLHGAARVPIRDAEEQTSQKRARAEIGPLIGETPLGERIGGPP
jgi:outer membrane protein TolC